MKVSSYKAEVLSYVVVALQFGALVAHLVVISLGIDMYIVVENLIKRDFLKNKIISVFLPPSSIEPTQTACQPQTRSHITHQASARRGQTAPSQATLVNF